MGQLTGRWMRGALLAPASLLMAGLAWAQEEAPLSLEERLAALETATSVPAYVDNSYLFLIGGLVVMFMAAGFCMLEAGLVRSKNAAMQSMKNVLLFSVAGLMFWLTGYNLAYPGDATLFSGLLPTNLALWEAARRLRKPMAAMPPAPTGSSRWCSWPPPRRSSPAPLPSA
jgi:ammonium transporter, Amt family